MAKKSKKREKIMRYFNLLHALPHTLFSKMGGLGCLGVEGRLQIRTLKITRFPSGSKVQTGKFESVVYLEDDPEGEEEALKLFYRINKEPIDKAFSRNNVCTLIHKELGTRMARFLKELWIKEKLSEGIFVKLPHYWSNDKIAEVMKEALKNGFEKRKKNA